MATLPDFQKDVTGEYTGNAYPERRNHRRRNRDACYARRKRRPHRPSWARSRHVFSIPRANETKALSPAGV